VCVFRFFFSFLRRIEFRCLVPIPISIIMLLAMGLARDGATTVKRDVTRSWGRRRVKPAKIKKVGRRRTHLRNRHEDSVLLILYCNVHFDLEIENTVMACRHGQSDPYHRTRGSEIRIPSGTQWSDGDPSKRISGGAAETVMGLQHFSFDPWRT